MGQPGSWHMQGEHSATEPSLFFFHLSSDFTEKINKSYQEKTVTCQAPHHIIYLLLCPFCVVFPSYSRGELTGRNIPSLLHNAFCLSTGSSICIKINYLLKRGFSLMPSFSAVPTASHCQNCHHEVAFYFTTLTVLSLCLKYQ